MASALDYEENECVEEAMLSWIYGLDPDLNIDHDMESSVMSCANVLRIGRFVQRRLKGRREETRRSPDVSIPDSEADAARQGVDFARKERKRMRLGAKPLPDLAELIYYQGIWIAYMQCSSQSVTAFCHESEDLGRAIIVNCNMDARRMRHEIALQYAHANLDRNFAHLQEPTDRQWDLMRMRATAFAAEFLMPKFAVLKLVKLHSSDHENMKGLEDPTAGFSYIAENRLYIPGISPVPWKIDMTSLMDHFDVGHSVMAERLHSLGIVSMDGCIGISNAMKSSDVLGMTKSRKEDKRMELENVELSGEIIDLAEKAFERSKISKLELSGVIHELRSPS